MSFADWDFKKLTNIPEFETKTVEFENKDFDIRLNGENTYVEFKKSDDEKIHITYTENEYETFTITEDSTISINHTRNYRWYDYIIMININQPKITVALPDNYAGDVSVLNNNGEIYIGSINALGNYYCNTHNGKITAEYVTAKDLELISNNGKIWLEKSTAETLKLTAHNGAIGLYDTKTESVIGKTNNGKISISNLDSQSIDFKTNNGDIVGDITGSFQDYKIDGKTKNGHSNLPSETFAGNRRLKAETNNGDIEILFLG